MIKHTILVVDDEPIQQKIIGKMIENLGYNSLIMSNGLEVVDFFMNKKVIPGISHRDIDVMLLDLSMPDLDGLTVLKQIGPIKGDLQVIVLTSSKDVTLAITAINYGALDYIVKGESDILSRVTASIHNAIEKRNLKYQISHMERKVRNQVSFLDIIGQSEKINRAIKLAKKVANSMIPVLIEGQSGTGKELIARAIHGSGPRSGKPFVLVACDYLKNEEELFGSERVLADGVIKNAGKIREANNGTIYFDKIDALKPDLQVKLLRFIQEGGFTPATSKLPVRSDVRIISSTTCDLEKMVAAKKIREDLCYLMSAFPIPIPSLKDRGEQDIKLLAENFCRDFSVNENKKIKTISPDAAYLLYNYEWEDNIRQLKNSVFRAVALCDDDVLKPEHFSQLLGKANSNLTRAKAMIKKESDISSELVDIFDDVGRCKTIDAIEEEVIRRLVDIYNGNLSEVAKSLDIGRSTVYRKLKMY